MKNCLAIIVALLLLLSTNLYAQDDSSIFTNRIGLSGYLAEKRMNAEYLTHKIGKVEIHIDSVENVLYAYNKARIAYNKAIYQLMADIAERRSILSYKFINKAVKSGLYKTYLRSKTNALGRYKPLADALIEADSAYYKFEKSAKQLIQLENQSRTKDASGLNTLSNSALKAHNLSFQEAPYPKQLRYKKRERIIEQLRLQLWSAIIVNGKE